MLRITLHLITATDGHTVLQKAPGDISPYQGHGGEVDLLCGACHHMLAEHVHRPWITGVALRCPICESLNSASEPDTGGPPPPDPTSSPVRARDLRRP